MSEEERKKLFEEEYYKFEVRKSLESKSEASKQSRVWKFLNSSFGLWLLSTVVLGFVVNLYGRYEEDKNTRIKNAETSRRLETEIDYRIHKFQIELMNFISNARINRDKAVTDSLRKAHEPNFNYTVTRPNPRNLFHSMDSLFLNSDGLVPITRDRWNIFPEYRDRKLETLLYEAESGDKGVKIYATGTRAEGWGKLREDIKVFLSFYQENQLLNAEGIKGDVLRKQFWDNWHSKLVQTQMRLIEWTGNR